MAWSATSSSRSPSILLLLVLWASIGQGYAFDSFRLISRSSDSCPTSYKHCGSTKLPDNFCCPSDSTCISLDDATSAICCPEGSDCQYITPIVCDIQEQNATLYPSNPIKTTRLGDSLPKCGEKCCPFGFTCDGNTCVMNKSASTTATASVSEPATTTASSTSTSFTGSATLGATFTPISSPSAAASTNTTSAVLSESCPSFPIKAIVAGFFPGAVFGAAAALLISFCLRRRARNAETKIRESKFPSHWSQRTSTGAVMSISRPIVSEDASYRTDFLLRTPPDMKRSSVGGRSTRSRMHRTGSRVRSLFHNNPRLDKNVPPIPVHPVTPPRQREPSTESIKVYSPPGTFAQPRKFLGPEPYPATIARPDTTFTDLIQGHGFSGPQGEPSYRIREDSKENPFRDPRPQPV